ncbi:hypothetical protein KDA_06080 [Dictyobacter alpinus]|uniref:Uncharacterized protein n=1 Tax=Dictyobacter alpinus TaxID=2014873 RepID=A0A402B192_9CHLR|nr:chemotaxis protein CheB [Dictyobacter alpinus]GCE25124.1 hypothetical protein KDA_06080 [Dictyobacter alpinus]
MDTIAEGTSAQEASRPLSFPIVGIGASVGGLEAFTQVLKLLPSTTNMAYVLVQHLDPTHTSLLAHLLTPTTPMRVQEARDGMVVQANQIYVIAPNTDLTLRESTLILTPRTTTINQHLSIDTFFSSLAENARHHPIGVILSGNASDGTRGIQVLKERGGVTLAQAADSAQAPTMPLSAIASGCIDFIGSPEQIAQELIRISHHPSFHQPITEEVTFPTETGPSREQAFLKILRLVRQRTTVDFTAYKSTTLLRRIDRRMVLQQIESDSAYLQYLRDHPAEITALSDDMLIGVTAFFRHPEAYQALIHEVLPHLLATRTASEQLRIWVAGCSTGEEVYSLAISVQEYLTERNLSLPFHIFGTDLNEKAIVQARKGIYTMPALSALSTEQIQRFFQQVNGNYQIHPSLREHCIFAQQNLLADPPFSHVDLLTCQNVLIYLKPEAQQKLIQTFHYALKLNGFLLLGSSETIGAATNLFAPVGDSRHLYRQKNTSTRFPFLWNRQKAVQNKQGDLLMEGHLMREEERPYAFDIQKEMDRLLLERYAPACVVIDTQMEILHFRGRTSQYLEPTAGKASLNLFKMARQSLEFALRTVITTARHSGQPVTQANVHFQDQAVQREITLEVIPLPALSTPRFFMILFHEPTSSLSAAEKPPLDKEATTSKARNGAKDRRIRQLEHELMVTRQQMHAIIEEMEASQEELQSANEEVLSSNEELRSLNEELETSKEEIQATNEELRSLNEELETSRKEIQATNEQLQQFNEHLHQGNEQLQEARMYAENIVNTIREPLLVLDANFCISSANPAFSQFFQLAPADIEQHPFFELDHHQWDIPELRHLLEHILPEQQMFQDVEIDHVFSFIGHKILLLNARRMPGTANREPHILLAFEDVTQRQELERHKDAFLAIASHELKTPVTSLKMYAQLLRRTYTRDGDEKAAHMLATMEEQANRLTHLVYLLLDTTQLQAGTLLLQPTIFDMNALVSTLIEQVQHTAETHPIQMEGRIQASFKGDPDRISQVLTNFLSNAIKYTPAETPILVRLAEEAEAIVLSVRDKGKGIPVEKQASLFERFYRVNDSSQTAIPGLGLGLYISSEIVKQHGGQVWVESQEGEGSTFFARFPRDGAPH